MWQIHFHLYIYKNIYIKKPQNRVVWLLFLFKIYILVTLKDLLHKRVLSLVGAASHNNGLANTYT